MPPEGRQLHLLEALVEPLDFDLAIEKLGAESAHEALVFRQPRFLQPADFLLARALDQGEEVWHRVVVKPLLDVLRGVLVGFEFVGQRPRRTRAATAPRERVWVRWVGLEQPHHVCGWHLNRGGTNAHSEDPPGPAPAFRAPSQAAAATALRACRRGSAR